MLSGPRSASRWLKLATVPGSAKTLAPPPTPATVSSPDRSWGIRWRAGHSNRHSAVQGSWLRWRGAPTQRAPRRRSKASVRVVLGDRETRSWEGRIRSTLKMALVVGCGVVLAASPPAVDAQFQTRATVYEPFRNDGTVKINVQSRRGYCWTGSLATNRYDAWRCFVGNYIFDPCFSSDNAPGKVVCPNGTLNGGIEIRLTRGLPYKYEDTGSPSIRGMPWDIQTLGGRYYVILTGATTVVDGQRLNYGCVSHGCNGALWGGPRRHTEPWTILWARPTATTLSTLVKLRHVWTLS